MSASVAIRIYFSPLCLAAKGSMVMYQSTPLCQCTAVSGR